ncbi:hypothetical protein JFL43_14930 [Viridibacillus sp. YIM B01967]|uniref:Uncharacterized protein n=1 Tax=Viridibacillus soli TaxID=2798301 RepID=A0ABS1H9N6_9BACL|nr:hypothetical protein [Viridibacillus soli]MBK3496129.1 hypothetical protein [Viridibacillus soli]
MVKRKRLLQGILVISVLEMLYYYFIGKNYIFINGLGDMLVYIIVGNVLLFVAYFLLVEKSNIRKKYALIITAYALLVVAPFYFQKHVPSFNVDDAGQIISRTEGGKVVKDRKFSGTIVDYSGLEVYIITLEKKKVISRYAFDPYTEKYYSFAD